MIDLLAANPLLLLFLVAATGYLVGHVRIAGFSLGIAAVLFVGMAFGALDERLKLPELVYLFGLVVFVYTIGLQNGPGFFASFGRRGLRDNLLVIGLLVLAFGVSLAAMAALGLRPAQAAGIFAGGLTNTPALAAVLERLAAGDVATAAEPVVAYSLTYPVGVLAPIVLVWVAGRWFRVDYAAEARKYRELAPAGVHLVVETVQVRPEAAGIRLDEVLRARKLQVQFGRIKRGGRVFVADADDHRFEPGDLVTVIGDETEVARAREFLGTKATERLELDRGVVDFRRMFVSNPKIAGQRLGDLDLPGEFGAAVTRLRRGDADLLASDDTVLELGDRVRVVAPRERMAALTRLFGDSYKSLSEVDVVTLGFGIAIGLLVGMIPVPIPGGTFKLGLAGGPLVVGLVLGRLGRTGPFLWHMPYSANLTLRQLGIILFLAGVGTRSGFTFVETISKGGWLPMLAAGAVITISVSLLALWVGHRLLHIPMGLLVGIVAGTGTQPAVLAFASEQAKNDLPGIGYAEVYPVATVGKIVLAQLLLTIAG